MLAILFGEILVSDYFHEECGGFFGARSPDNVASGGAVPVLSNAGQPGIEKRVPLPVSANPECFQVPSILAVMLQARVQPRAWELRAKL